MNPREDFLLRVFQQLEQRGLEYCVTRNFDTVFADQRSDVDLLTRARDLNALRDVCEAAGKESGFTLVQAPRFTNQSWVFAHHIGTLVRIDIDTSIRWRCFHVLSAEEVLRERRRGERFFIPAPHHEAAILRTQIAWRGETSERYTRRLLELGEASVSPVQARSSIALHAFAHPFEVLTSAASDLSRFFDRCFGAWFETPASQRGACIVLAGLDGAGKTTFARTLFVDATRSRRFAGVRYFHWIPSPFRRPEFPWPAEGERPRLTPQQPGALSAAKSAARLARNLLLAWLGFALVVRPLVRRGWLVVIDRYVTNYWLDPVSVRYAGPDWWLDWVEPLFPKADILAVLDTDAATLRSRKGELSEAQIAEQRARLRSLPALADSRLDLDAAQPVDALVRQALAHLAKR